MHLPGLSRIRREWKRVRNRYRPSGLILLYHRVAEPSSDPQLLSVTPQRFFQHLAHLSDRYQVVGLEELIERLAGGERGTARLVAVTFDDGYADNLHHAKSILEAHGMPATVFVATGSLDQQRCFWWDDLERIFLRASSLPKLLRLEIAGQVHEWDLGSDACYRREREVLHRAWNVLRSEDPTARHRIYRSLCRILRPMSAAARQTLLDLLWEWAGYESEGACDARLLTSQEIRQLAGGGRIRVGAHTMSHPVLAALPIDSQLREIVESKGCLEDILGRPVTSFAYPYGTRADYTEQTAALVREQGFSCACSNYPDTVTGGTNAYELPRFVVRNWSGEQFASTVKAWFDGAV